MQMMIDIAKFITVLIFLKFQLKITSVGTETISGCEVAKDEHGTIVANCRGKGITSIPQNLGATVNVLDISENNDTLTALHKDDLQNYPKLWGLIMKDLPVTNFPTGFFRHSSLLTMLNITNTQIENLIEIPASIQILNFTWSTFEDINLSHLINLKELFLRHSTKMKRIPSLHQSAPLLVLDVKFCPLREGSYTQISSFCQLRYFGLFSKVLQGANFTFQCCEFRLWSRIYGIKYGWQAQNCSKHQYDNCAKVPFEFSEEAMQAHDKCDSDLRKKIFIKALIIFLAISIIITIPTVYFVHRHYKKHLSSIETTKRSVTSLEGEVEEEAELQSND